MSRTDEHAKTPRAMVHRRILDVAESNPSASMEEIADEIGSATVELVERVLEQYGDPADDQQDSQDDNEMQGSPNEPNSSDGDSPEIEDHAQHDGIADRENTDSVTRDGQHTGEHRDDRNVEVTSPSSISDQEPSIDQDGRCTVDSTELTEKQLKTLRLIDDAPDASQSDLAEELDVTRATISRWLNDIPGFEWTQRQELATEILGDDEMRGNSMATGVTRSEAKSSEVDHSKSEASERDGRQEFNIRLDAIETQLEQLKAETEPKPSSLLSDPDLAYKVVHASISSDLLTEEEELQLLKELMD